MEILVDCWNKNYFLDTFGHLSLESPSLTSIDITKDIQEREYYINSYKLFQLSDVCKKQLMAVIMWPWRWSEFIHSCGQISLENIFNAICRNDFLTWWIIQNLIRLHLPVKITCNIILMIMILSWSNHCGKT